MATALQNLTTVGVKFEVPPDLSDRKVQERLSPSAIKALIKITENWGITQEEARELAGGVSHGKFHEWKRGNVSTLRQDELTRVSLVLGIYRALNILYSKPLAAAWVKLHNTNPLMTGGTPLDYMIRGGVPAMVTIRRLLDARRGG